MKVYFLDAGTTYSKILEVSFGVKTEITGGADVLKKYSVIKTSDLSDLNINFEISTGHSSGFIKSKKYENEAVALSFGAKNITGNNPDSVILDLGSRDAKWVKFKSGKFFDMDWNTNCASSTGATIEMLLKFYNVAPSSLVSTSEKYPVTCGVFGLEKIMDDISAGIEPRFAISKFITGVAFNAYNFTKKPDKIYLSGGFCENKCFVDSLKYFTNVILTGRYLLVDGLFNIYKGQI